ncbi:hypothetical protein B0A55_08023 [Friedmanniomyces simplex]|uniref:C2H2-type domain-containing protein n=1 Tax=Friedmanniomyces simplex TaxID=329884 RepID=A0A4U0X4K7_9PEZI|nr:hypothetical protein B0A55_08023 [Friedmanniomyces simplex]
MEPESTPPGQSASTKLKGESDSPTTAPRPPSPRPARSVSEQPPPPTNEPVASGTGPLPTDSPQRHGSSRENEMQRSSTPPDGGSIRYTRTGRVSKATKGQRVHQCEECGKLYTRAEHLRRHKQNHKPGAFVCDIPGCGRSFYREDLLIRHKERHNDPLDPPTRRPSIGSQTSGHGLGGPSQPRALTAQNADANTDSVLDEHQQAMPAATTQQSTASRAPERKTYIPLNELHVAPQIRIPTNGGGLYSSEYPSRAPYEPSPPYSPSGYDSPPDEYSYANGPPYYGQPPQTRARIGSMANAGGVYVPPASSRSPVSAGSSTMYLPQWGPGAQSPAALPHFASSAASETFCHEISANLFAEHLIPFKINGVVVRMILPEERDTMEMENLIVPSVSSSTGDLTLDCFTNEQRYLGSYWMWIHPLFPVVHKPSFNLQTASPLLRSTMLALGAHMLQNSTDMGNARIIHECAQKVLKKRAANGWDTYRVCDMQAIVLHEIFAIFRSRRPPLQFTKNFDDIYRYLARDLEAVNQELAHPLYDSPVQTRNGFDDLAGTVPPRLEAKCKQRLLLACYVIDQQHAMLFGRQRTDCISSSMSGLTGTDLPFVRSQAYWDATPDRHPELWAQKHAAGLTPYDQVYGPLSAVPTMTALSDWPHDAFRSMLMLTALTDPDNDLQACGIYMDDPTDPSAILFAVEQTPRMRLAYHTLMLCRHTPIRDLLAVAGETWVLGEKIGSQDHFVGAQLSARDWAMGPATTAPLDFGSDDEEQQQQQPESSVHRALYHALRILEIHHKHPKTGLLFQEWSLHLAAIVIWARAYISDPSSSSNHQKTTQPQNQPAEPQLSPHDLEESLLATIAAGSRAVLTRMAAKNVLQWTKIQIERVDVPHNCGLTNCALDVLGKLVGRGGEEGWFA